MNWTGIGYDPKEVFTVKMMVWIPEHLNSFSTNVQNRCCTT
jgi:hypothetical protein